MIKEKSMCKMMVEFYNRIVKIAGVTYIKTIINITDFFFFC